MKRFILMVAMLLATLTVTTAQRKVVTDKLQVTELKNAETIGFDDKGNAVAKEFPKVGNLLTKKQEVVLQGGYSIWYNDKVFVLFSLDYSEKILFENYKNTDVCVASIQINKATNEEKVEILEVIHIDSDEFIYTKKNIGWVQEDSSAASPYYSPTNLVLHFHCVMVPVEMLDNPNAKVKALLSVQESLTLNYQQFYRIENEMEKTSIKLKEIENRVGTHLNRGALFYISKKDMSRAFPRGGEKAGTIIYDKNDNKLKFYDGTSWHNLY